MARKKAKKPPVVKEPTEWSVKCVDTDFGKMVTEYYPTGEVASVYNIVKNKLSGMFKMYYKTGAIALEVDYVDGLRQGTETEYYESGSILRHTHNYVDGRRHGSEKVYYEDGTVKIKTSYEADHVVGDYVTYHPTGAVSTSANYQGGVCDGLFQEFCVDGVLKHSVMFKAGIAVPDGN